MRSRASCRIKPTGEISLLPAVKTATGSASVLGIWKRIPVKAARAFLARENFLDSPRTLSDLHATVASWPLVYQKRLNRSVQNCPTTGIEKLVAPQYLRAKDPHRFLAI